MAKKKQIDKPAEKGAKLKILVSSVVYGYEDLLETIYALLESFGYDVLMSHKGTVPVDPEESAMDSCLQAVDECDLFLGVILPRYGSGKETPGDLSITHREAEKAINDNKPRWFLVHEHVAIARQLLSPYRVKVKDDKGELTDKCPFEFLPEIKFGKTPILSDVRVVDLFELAMRHDVPDVPNREGNWVQPFGPDDDARLFVTAQFRRYRELYDKHLLKLKDGDGIRKRVNGGEQ